MFKRVDKRRRKKEEEEKLGLDEEVKEILGIHDTDSEESESDSDSDEGEEEEEEEEESVADDEENFGEEDVDDEEDDDEEEKKEDPSITVSQALKDPLYVVSVLPDMKACIVCPDKLLKSLKMAHIRRFKRFSDSSANAKPNDNAWDILKRDSKTKPKLSLTTSSGVSKRAEKKKKASQARKARREEAKVKAKAKKAKAISESTGTSPGTPGLMKPKSPPKKKRKIDLEQIPPSVKISTPSTPPSATKKRDKKKSTNTKLAPAASGALEDDDNARRPPNIQDSVKIQDIVKFASNRAKTARSRALSMSKRRKSSN